MDLNEKNIIELYKKEAKSNEPKALKGYLNDPNFSDIPKEVKNLSLGLWNPLRHETIVPEKGFRVLDIGCGSGMDLFYLFKKYPGLEFYGADLCIDLLEKGQRVHNKNSFKPYFVNANIADLPFHNNSFNMILAHAVIHLSKKKEKIFSECHRILKDGGVLLFCDPIIDGEMPELMRREYESTEGIFLYGGLEDIKKYRDYIQKAGFEYFDHIEQIDFNPKNDIRLLLKKKFGDLPDVFIKELSSLRFFIETVAAVKGNGYGKRRVKCSNCGKENIIKYRSVINALKEKDYERMLFNHELNITDCEECGSLIDCPEPFLFISRFLKIFNKLPIDYKGKKFDIESYFYDEFKPETIYDPEEFLKINRLSFWKKIKSYL